MDFLLNCACFQRCPLSGKEGTYNSYDREQLQRQKRHESCEQQARAAVAEEVTLPNLEATQESPALATADSDAIRKSGDDHDKLASRRLEKHQRFLEKYASINEENSLLQQRDGQRSPSGETRLATTLKNIGNNKGEMGNVFNATANTDNPAGPSRVQHSGGIQPTGPVLSSFTLEGIAELIRENKINKSSVIVLVGAGMSTSAGVPDFRSPDKGIYANLQKYNLAHPEDVFKISYFKNNPAPFYDLSRTLLPKRLYPTISHYFVRLLHEKGFLLRCFSQNVDCLESLCGIPKEKLCLAHGSFETGHCLRCNAEYSLAWMRQIVEQGGIPHCIKTQDCKGLIKPDVKFFGERLDGRFFRLVREDFPHCELLIIIGSSLSVMPFAQLVQKVPPRCPRLLINKTKSGHCIPAIFRIFKPSTGLMYDHKGNVRDVAYLSDCDEACRKLADLLGWSEELLETAERRRKEIEDEQLQPQQEIKKD